MISRDIESAFRLEAFKKAWTLRLRGEIKNLSQRKRQETDLCNALAYCAWLAHLAERTPDIPLKIKSISHASVRVDGGLSVGDIATTEITNAIDQSKEARAIIAHATAEIDRVRKTLNERMFSAVISYFLRETDLQIIGERFARGRGGPNVFSFAAANKIGDAAEILLGHFQWQSLFKDCCFNPDAVDLTLNSTRPRAKKTRT